MRNITILILIVPLISITNPFGNQNQMKGIYHNDNKCIKSCRFKVINENFVKNIFTINIFTADTSKIKNIFKAPVNLKIIKEKGIDDYEYFNYFFESKNSYIKLFKNDEGFYIDEVHIKDNSVKICKGLFIGMEKKSFIKLLSIKNTECNIITVTNEDQTLELDFIFHNNLLTELIIESSD